MKKMVVILSVLLLVTFSCIALTDNKKVRLGKNIFCIPEKYDILDQTSGPVINIKGADKNSYSGSFQLAVEAPEVRKSIVEYFIKHGGLHASLLISVRQMTPLERSLNNNFYANVLQLTDNYENAYVQYDAKHAFYHINSWGKSSPPFILWEVLKIKPHKNAVIPENVNDYHVASCSSMGGVDGFDETGSTCDYSLEINGYLVVIKTTGNNLHLKEKITRFVKNLLDSSRENCK